jgi:hypothetical protein
MLSTLSSPLDYPYATSSTSSPTDEEYTQVTHEEILLLLRLRKESTEKQTAEEFFNKGLAYLLSLHQDNADELHWFCNEELSEIATELLHLFSLQVSDEFFEEFKKILKEKLGKCLECVKNYTRNKEELYERQVDDLLNIIY